MESPSPKPQFTSDYQEFETRDAGYQKSVRKARLVESIRLALTALALLAGITIVGTSADALSVYNTTHLEEAFLLPLWPSDFDIRPTISLVTCGAIVFVSSAISLVVSKLPPVSIYIQDLPYATLNDENILDSEQPSGSCLGFFYHTHNFPHRWSHWYLILLWCQRL